jgi:wyosine [tRNA(Phe)-imidazoG37] synthetase (radical SAM superfamily)
MKPKESDWKKFKNSLDKWRERYLKRKNDEIRAILKDNDLDETEKFWNIVDFQKNVSKILRNCFDGYSRSRMSLHMALMKKFEMIYQEDIEEFSKELQEHLKNVERI